MPGTEPQVAPTEPQPQPGKVLLDIAADRMEVRAVVVAPMHGGEAVTVEHLMAELLQAKVVHGIDMDAVVRLVGESDQLPPGKQSRRAVVARGTPPVRGKDGSVQTHELLQTPSGYPRLLDDGKVDFFSLNMVRNVPEGLVLAHRLPASKGTPGSDCLGNPITAADGREAKLRAGKGTKLSADGNSVESAVAGHAAMTEGGEISVSPIFVVKEDVDFSTGSIDFSGTVVVRGNVNQGFTVKAGQNIEVHGGIMGGVVEAGGDVIVRYGILGAGKGRVIAGGRVQARFVETAEIRAGGDVTVVDGILHSKVQSGGSVNLTGGRGSILGGQIRAREQVNAKSIGSSAGAVTEIMVGINPEIRAEYDQLRHQLAQLDERMTRAFQTASFLKEVQARTPQAFNDTQRQVMLQSARLHNQLKAEREPLQARLEKLQSEVESVKTGAVRAFEVAYPGVRIVIGSERFAVMDLYHRTWFFLSEGGTIGIAPA